MSIRAVSLTLLILVSMLAIVFTPRTVTAQKTWNGPYVGEVVFVRSPDIAISVEKLIAGEYDVLFDEIATSALYQRIREAGLPYTVSYGLYYEITLNYMCVRNETTGEMIKPVFPNPSKLPDPTVQGKILFNPFCNPRIRYAMHFLIDRNFIAERIGEGLLVPRYTAITPAFPDYGRLADTIIPLEMQLSYDFAKARNIIFEEMQKMGATYVNGKWYYNNTPVTLIFLIRVEDVRKDIGDYIASQLERLGFTVLRYYGRSAQLAPYWLRADPADGTFHLYTGGWITTAVDRDQGPNFGFFYTKLGRPELLWQRIINTPEFFEVADKLYYNKYSSIEERRELMAKALNLSVTVENQRIFIANRISVWARRPNVEISTDLAGGYPGSQLWPWTLKFTDKTGADLRDSRVTIAYRDLLIEPWNPIGGSNWIYDMTIIRATGDSALYPDPYSGLYWPHRVSHADVYVNATLPMGKTLDWVTLYKVNESIVVPDDAWLLYDYQAKKIRTVGEVKANTSIVQTLFNITDYTAPETAQVKIVVTFDDKLFNGYKWHDGSQFDIADILYAFILAFDRVSIGSPLYDENAVPSFESWFPTFKGLKIINTNPLVMEIYSDIWYLDAEVTVAANIWWPYYSQGPGAWHAVELAAEAERRGLMAFTSGKANTKGVPQTDLLSPTILQTLSSILDEFINETHIPYPEVLGQYINSTEAAQRWQNLKNFYNTYGHMWVGNGPFMLVSASKDQIVLRAFRDHVDPCNKYAFLTKPPVPVVNVNLPPNIYYGRDLEVTVEVTDEAGNPYPDQYIELVSYVIMHAGGYKGGRAEPLGGGLYRIYLTADEVNSLSVGTIQFTVIAVSKIVGIPGTQTKTTTMIVPPEVFIGQLKNVTTQIGNQINQISSDLSNRISTLSDDMRRLLGEQIAQVFSELTNTLNTSLTRISSALQTGLQGTATAVNTTVSSVKDLGTKVDDLSNKVDQQGKTMDERISKVEDSVSSLAGTVNMVLAVAIISIVLSLVNLFMFFRKK